MGQGRDYSDGDVTKMPELECKEIVFLSHQSLMLIYTFFHDCWPTVLPAQSGAGPFLHTGAPTNYQW